MGYTINQYKSYVESRRFTQSPSHYTMKIDGAELKILYPDSILLPGRNFINTPFSYYGPEFTLPLKREYNELSVNFIVYQDWAERIYFEQWMDEILPYQANNISVQSSDILPDDLKKYLRKITVNFYERTGTAGNVGGLKPEVEFELYDSYPLLITPTSFTSENAGYTIFTVNFAYRYYTTRAYGPGGPLVGGY